MLRAQYFLLNDYFSNTWILYWEFKKKVKCFQRPIWLDTTGDRTDPRSRCNEVPLVAEKLSLFNKAQGVMVRLRVYAAVCSLPSLSKALFHRSSPCLPPEYALSMSTSLPPSTLPFTLLGYLWRLLFYSRLHTTGRTAEIRLSRPGLKAWAIP